MDDYISREDAVEWFMSFIMMDEDNIPADVVVGDLKTAIPAADVEPVRHGEMRWIPCSERLPELQDTRCVRTVIVCARGHVMPMIYERDIVQGKAVGLWKWMWRGIFKEPEAITHWMPLPEPPVKDGAEIYVSFADDSDFTGGSKP